MSSSDFFPLRFFFKFIQIIEPQIKCIACLACEIPRSVCQGVDPQETCDVTIVLRKISTWLIYARNMQWAWSVSTAIPGLFLRGREEGSRLSALSTRRATITQTPHHPPQHQQGSPVLLCHVTVGSSGSLTHFQHGSRGQKSQRTFN